MGLSRRTSAKSLPLEVSAWVEVTPDLNSGKRVSKDALLQTLLLLHWVFE